MVPDVALPHFRGASTHVYEVSRNLSARGHRLWVISRRLSYSQPRLESIDGFETYRTFQGLAFEPPMSSYSPTHVDRDTVSNIQRLYSWYLGSYRAFQLGLEVAAIMVGRGIDVVIERETAFGAGAVLSRILRVPLVLEMIGPRVSPMSLKRASRVLAYSSLMTGGRVPSDKVKIVPAGVDIEMFSPDPAAGKEVREMWGMKDELVIGYVGTFRVWHGVDDLLRAVKRLPPSRRVRVLLVGPYFGEALRTAESLGVAKHTIFAGPVPYDTIPKYINACDILCAPYNPGASKSRSRRGIGAPLKVLEYMACGKAVISTRIPPMTEVVDDGRTGLLVQAGDVDSLAGALLNLIDNDALTEAIGIGARNEVVAKYSWDYLAGIMEDVLDSVTKHQGRGGGLN